MIFNVIPVAMFSLHKISYICVCNIYIYLFILNTHIDMQTLLKFY